jgi:hypothetical protein
MLYISFTCLWLPIPTCIYDQLIVAWSAGLELQLGFVYFGFNLKNVLVVYFVTFLRLFNIMKLFLLNVMFVCFICFPL